MVKAIVNFRQYTDTALNPPAQGIQSAMTLNAKTFANPPVTMTDLQTLIDTYHTAMANINSAPSAANTMAKNTAKAALTASLSLLGTYVNLIAQGDAAIIALSGFPSFNTVSAPLPSVRPAPANLTLATNAMSGYVDVSAVPYNAQDTQSVECSATDPTVNANWVHAESFKGSSVTIGAYTPGSTVWVRWRSNGPGGVHGIWSAVAQIRVM